MVNYHLCGQTSRFSVWVNGMQNLRLVNFILESHLPFAPISCIYRKTDTKDWIWYQRWLWKNGTQIFRFELFFYSNRGNRTTYSDIRFLPEIFLWNDRKVITFHLLSWKLLEMIINLLIKINWKQWLCKIFLDK